MILLRDQQGALFDLIDHRRVSLDEMRDKVRAGERFRVYDQHHRNCTIEVVMELVTTARSGSGLSLARFFGSR